MFTFIVVLIALIALFMTIVILLQSGQGGGLAGIASGGATRQVLGSRQAPDILEKATWTLGIIFVFLCIASNFLIGGNEAQESIIQQNARDGQTQQQSVPSPSDDGGAAPMPSPSGGGGN